MTYLPFVYLILLSPEQYYNNLRIQNGYHHPMPLDSARKIDVRDKIQQPVVYLPYVLLSPYQHAAPLEKSMDGNEVAETKKGGGAESEGNMDDDNNNKENGTLRNNTMYNGVGYSLVVQSCQDGLLPDENGNCLKGISKGVKELELDRKKRATTQQKNSKGRMMFKLSKKISVRDRRSAEEKKLSYADVVKYGRRRPFPLAKEMQTGTTTLKTLSVSTTTAKTTRQLKEPAVPLLPPGIPVPSYKSANPSPKPTQSKITGKPVESSSTTVTPDEKFKMKPHPVKSKPSVGKESSRFINSEADKKLDEPLPTLESPSKTQENPDRSSGTSTTTPYLHLVSAFCESGYVKDENGNCIKAVKIKNSNKVLSSFDRKRRSTDGVSFLRGSMDEEDGIVDHRKLQHSFYYKRGRKLENDTRKTETTFMSRLTPTSTPAPDPDILEKTPDKNAASDGFGYISKECSKLVPGLVSDGAGGCTKSVKPKEKILQLERRKRQARTAYINFIDPNNVLRKNNFTNNFTIRITLKGFTKQLNFTGGSRDEPYDDGNKAVADNGFGVTSSKCDNLVPGLISDGVGGCTKAVSTIRKRNKFSFILKNVENTQPLIDVEYENPESELVHSNEEHDPDADII